MNTSTTIAATKEDLAAALDRCLLEIAADKIITMWAQVETGLISLEEWNSALERILEEI
jgi:hypothetical protein